MACKIVPDFYITIDPLRFHQRHESINPDRFIKCVGRPRLDVGFCWYVEPAFAFDTLSQNRSTQQHAALLHLIGSTEFVRRMVRHAILGTDRNIWTIRAANTSGRSISQRTSS